MKRILFKLYTALCIMLLQTSVYAGTGNLFTVTASGTPATISVTVCLDAVNQISCQTFNVTALSLNIHTTIAGKTYPNAGFKVNTAGYETGSGCTLLSNGFCSFSASDTGQGTDVTVQSSSAQLYGVTYYNQPEESTAILHNLYTIDPATADTSLVMALSNGGSTSVIASNGTSLYHLSGSTPVLKPYAQVFESVDISGQTTSSISLSGAPLQSPYGMGYHNGTGAFLVSTSSQFYSLTTGGFASNLIPAIKNKLITSELTGLACYNHKIYGIRRPLDNLHNGSPVVEQINPANGDNVSSSSAITLSGYTVNGAYGLTVNPTTGVFYAILSVSTQEQMKGASSKHHTIYPKLVTIDVTTGVATAIGDLVAGSSTFTSLAFHPADSSC